MWLNIWLSHTTMKQWQFENDNRLRVKGKSYGRVITGNSFQKSKVCMTQIIIVYWLWNYIGKQRCIGGIQKSTLFYSSGIAILSSKYEPGCLHHCKNQMLNGSMDYCQRRETYWWNNCEYKMEKAWCHPERTVMVEKSST